MPGRSCCLLAALFLGTPAVAQPPREDGNKDEVEKLRAQVKALQAELDALRAQVQALQAQLRAVDKGEPTFPEPPPGPSAPVASSDPAVKTGVNVGCLHQVVPGVQGAKFPRPTPYPGATVRVIGAPGKKVLAEGKTSESGGVLLAVPRASTSWRSCRARRGTAPRRRSR